MLTGLDGYGNAGPAGEDRGLADDADARDAERYGAPVVHPA